MTGLYAANAIQAALHHRHQTGRGQHIDLALMDVQVAMLANQALNYFVTGRNPGRWGNAHPNIVPYQAFAAQDGDLVVAVGNDGQFTRLCQAIGAGDLVTDPRFTRNADRVKNRAALVTRLQAVFAEEPVTHWIDRLDAAGVPVGGVNGLDQVFADPQVVSRGLRIDLPHATLGTAPGVASPIRLSDADIGATSAPPALGADTRQVLSDRLGLDDGRLRQLADDGVIA
jgi:crotonobetainyl-CoA:carnitine CoA-transferase CaiB-like acyl-CoA transferase